MPPVIALGVGYMAGGIASAAIGTAVGVVAKAVIVGAVAGAVAGAANAAMTGGDVLKGALTGAAIGGVTGGIAASLGGSGVGVEGTSDVAGVSGQTGQQAAAVPTTGDSIGGMSMLQEGATTPTVDLTSVVRDEAVKESTKTGLIGGAKRALADMTPEAKAALIEMSGGAMQGIGQYYAAKSEASSMERMQDRAHERAQVTDIPDIPSLSITGVNAPAHWQGLSPGAPDRFQVSPGQPQTGNYRSV